MVIRLRSNQVTKNRTTAQWDSDSFSTSMITERIGQHKVLLSVIHKNYSFREKKNSQVIKERENLYSNSDKWGVNCLMLHWNWNGEMANRRPYLFTRQTDNVKFELFSYWNSSFCSNKFTCVLGTWIKTL